MLFMDHQHVVTGIALQQTYSVPLVVLSILIAIISSFSAFGTAERIYAAPNSIQKLAWNIFGATAMGAGIWAMHFVGMLALSLPVPVTYDVTITVISVMPAIAASSVVLWMMTRAKFTRVHLLLGGLLLGAGIGAMHHLGMSAMRMDASMQHETFLFYLSLIEAVVMATIALKIKRQATNQQQYKFVSKPQIHSAIVMGLATSSMHYTAMMSVDFYPRTSAESNVGIDISTLTIMVSIVVFMMLLIAILLPHLLRYKQTVAELARLVDQEKEDKIRIRTIIDSTFDALIRCNYKGEIIGWSLRAENIFGWSETYVMGRKIHEIIIPKRYHQAHQQGINRFLKTKKGKILDQVIELEALHRQGHEFPIELTLAAIKIKGSYEFNAFIRDITERKQAQAEQYLLAKVFSDAHEGILITDTHGLIVDVNPTFTEITGYSREEVIGRNPRLLSSGKHTTEFYADMWEAIAQNGHWQGEIWNRRKSGEIYAEMMTISALTDDGEVTHYVCLFSDITKSKEQQTALQQMAHYDALTQLPNRSLFADRFSQAIAHSKRNKGFLAVCFIDLDSFKPINDTHGHEVGDQLLIEVSARILDNIREQDTASRQGGDEFALLLSDIESVEQCEQLLMRIHDALAKPYFISGYPHKITASTGVTFYPMDDGDIDTLMRHADQAMYQAKLEGKNRYHVFNALDDLQAIQQHHQLDEIRNALSNDEMQLYYQPKVDMQTGKVFGMEALIRWIHPDNGLIPPLDFLPIIEGTDLEVMLGGWVINTAIKQLDDWQEQGISLQVSINISSHHLLSPAFFDQLNDALDRYPEVESADLQLEILESSALGDISVLRGIIKSCQNALGIHVALDDFGTGYSSLTHIRNLPADTIKIDQSFVRDLLDDPNDYSIIEGVIGLAQAFNRDVIAEGVETEEHGLMLIIMGCYYAQGYGISRPIPAGDVEEWVHSYKPNKNWLALAERQISVQEQKILLIKLTTKHWFNNMNKALLSDNTEVAVQPTRCHLGVWIERLKKEKLFDEQWILQIQAAHDDMYTVANELHDMFQGENHDAMKQELNKLTVKFEKVDTILDNSVLQI